MTAVRLPALATRAGGWALLVLSIASAAGAQAVNWPQENPPRPLPSREVRFPPYEVRTLANGMQVVAVLHHEQPAVTMRLSVRAGAAHDPDKKGGVANLVAQLLDQGTTTRSASQIADQIDSIGGLLGTGSGPDRTAVSAVVMKDSFQTAMDLLGDVVRNPAFAEEEIERQKQQVMSSLQVSREDPDYVASTLFDRLVYGFHPYGMPGTGTPDTLASITRQDLQAFHRQHFLPNNMLLAIVGDVTSEEAFGAAERVFGRLPRGEVPALKPVDPPPSTRRIIVVDKPDSVQTEIRVGQLAIPRKHADYLAFDLAVKILGGEGANRLHRVLRSERGLTYGASADTQAMKQAGDFVAETDTRTETTGEALRLMVEEFSRLQRQRVFERELADAQAYLAGSFPLTIETPNDIASVVIDAVFYELPMAEIGTFRERVQAITPDDIQRVARQYVRPDRLSIVLVGNAKAFAPQLKALGFAEFEVIPIEQLDLMSGTLKREAPRASAVPAALRPAPRVQYTEGQVNPGAGSGRQTSPASPQPPRAPATPASPRTAAPASGSDPAATELLRKVVDAKGGLAALKAVKTVVVDAETTLQLAQGPLPSASKTYVMYPDKFRVDINAAGADVIQIYNAGNGWEKSPAGVRDVPLPMRDEFAASVRRDTIPLLLAASAGELRARSFPDEKGRDGRALKVIEVAGSHLPPVKLYIDDQMMIVRQTFGAAGPDNRSVTREEVFSDYRVVDGIRVAFEAQVLENGRAIVKRTLKAVRINPPIDESLFARPR